MEFLGFHKRTFKILWVLFALICISEVLLFRAELVPLEWRSGRIQLALFVLPFFLFMATHLLLIYRTWIREKNRTLSLRMNLVFFFVLSCAIILILIGFLVHFLL